MRRRFRISICCCPVIAILILSLPGQDRPQSGSAEPWAQQGVIHNAASPHALLHSVPVRAVRLGRGFWSARIEANRIRSLPSLLTLLEEHGVVDNFRRISGRTQVPRRGPLYTDSDLFKWMEAAAFVLQSGDAPEIRASLDKMIDEVAAAQDKNGYLNTYYSLERAGERFTNFQHGHELYCLGHLIQAGIAYYRATGEKRLLDVGSRYADHAIAVLGPGKKPAFTGHPELEMALVELYRTTGERRYLEFADYLLNAERPELNLNERDAAYAFSGIPFAKRTKFEGHSVRAMYAASGAADFFAESGNAAVRETLERLWTDLLTRKMYITGGIGSRSSGEAIGEPYELPNEQAYTETCAAIGNTMWNWRMLSITRDARFADVAERALYNGVLSGVSLSGDLYFYRNPLSSLGRTERRPWYSTTCCPPNIQRTLASLPGCFYSTSARGLYVHLYHNSQLDWHLEDGRRLRVAQQTDYPWTNVVDLVVSPESASRFSLFLRIPGWCGKARVSINGKAEQKPAASGTYVEIERDWRPGDHVRLELEMPVALIEANPRVREDFGRLAVMRGPLVYCLEGADLGRISPFDVSLLVGKPADDSFSTEFRPDLLGGVTVIRAQAMAAATSSVALPLYRMFGRQESSGGPQIEITLIPYYAWANRAPSEMEVWLPWARRN